jgi:hypothetical protein
MSADHALAIRNLLTNSPRSALRHASGGLQPARLRRTADFLAYSYD